jgi:GTP-binding protein YchF
MSLKVGIVGLPNVGKSTLFNALLKKQQAYVANFPFATIEPNIGVVPVPDERLSVLANIVKETEGMDGFPPEVPATVEFVDIAGLIKGASKGEGLGNKFLSHIRETDAICHVIRVFSDPDIVKNGVVNPKDDFETIETELAMADYETLEKQKDPGGSPDKELQKRWALIKKLREKVQTGKAARYVEMNEEEIKIAKSLSLLTLKPILVALNVDEADLARAGEIEEHFSVNLGVEKDQVVAICAKTEAELSDLSPEDQKSYLKDLGVEKSGLERLIQKAFSTLGLITFLTAGVKEVRAWTIKEGINAQEASGVIHTDFMLKFIKADIVNYQDFSSMGWKKAREEGKCRSEGRDYIMKDGDVVEFKIGQ